MQYSYFYGECPFELGDVVTIHGGPPQRITEIACIHYVKSGKIEFMYELDGSGPWTAIKRAYNEKREAMKEHG